MEDEYFLEMLESAIKDAANSLLVTQSFQPFAQALKNDNSIMNFLSNDLDDDEAYIELSKRVQLEVENGDIKAIVLLQKSLLPQQFNMNITQSIRVHIESKDNLHEKLGARFLYVPYEEGNEQEGIKLFNPKPIAFSHEIFKGTSRNSSECP